MRAVRTFLRTHFFFLYRYLLVLKAYFNFPNERRILTGKPINSNNAASVLFFTTHKAASTFFVRFFHDIAVHSGLIHLDFDSYFANRQIPVARATADPAFLERAYRPRGFLYGPMREMRQVPDLSSYKVFLFLRDPRDVLVSYYYSMAFSHEIISAGMLEKRGEALRYDLDGYVREKTPWFAGVYRAYLDLLTLPAVLFLRYEDMVLSPRAFLEKIERFIGFTLPSDRKDDIIRQELRQGVDNDKTDTEDIYSHRRSGRLRTYQEKLRPETIAYLNEQFARVLSGFGFNHE